MTSHKPPSGFRRPGGGGRESPDGRRGLTPGPRRPVTSPPGPRYPPSGHCSHPAGGPPSDAPSGGVRGSLPPQGARPEPFPVLFAQLKTAWAAPPAQPARHSSTTLILLCHTRRLLVHVAGGPASRVRVPGARAPVRLPGSRGPLAWRRVQHTVGTHPGLAAGADEEPGGVRAAGDPGPASSHLYDTSPGLLVGVG